MFHLFFKVVTKDGYILSIQRIPEGRNEARNERTKKQPVILQHGVLVVSVAKFIRIYFSTSNTFFIVIRII